MDDSIDVEILYSIISGYPEGISFDKLQNDYRRIKCVYDSTGTFVDVSSTLSDLKGKFIDYKTTNGIRIYFDLGKKVKPTSVHPFITELGPESKLHEVYAVHFLDCNSFVIHFEGEEAQAANFASKLNDLCVKKQKPNEMSTVEPWQVNLGDCYVTYREEISKWIRVKVVQCDCDEETVVCYDVDSGLYYNVKIFELRILLGDELFDHSLKVVKACKNFKHHSFAIRCCLDVEMKPYNGFPMSRTGFRLALCGKEKLPARLKVRFLSYDKEYDSFTTEVFTNDGSRNKLVDAIEEDQQLLEMDRKYAMMLDGNRDGDMFGDKYETGFESFIGIFHFDGTV